MTHIATLLIILSIPCLFLSLHSVNYKSEMKQGWKWLGISWLLIIAGYMINYM